MSEATTELQNVNWRRCLSFLEILRSFRMAVHPVKLFLCFLGLAASFWFCVLIDQIPGIGQTSVNGATFFENMYETGTRTVWGDWALPYVDGKTWDDFFTFLMSPVTAVKEVIVLIVAYWEDATWFALISTICSLGIWAFIGGAVTRMAAVRIAREESVPMKKALAFSCRKWPSIVTSPLIPFGVLVLLALVVGVLTGVPLALIPYVGEVLIPLVFLLTLFMGIVMALIFIGGAFSVGLQWPTIAAEGSDAFDAISRSVAYISSRPWRYLFYTVFSIVYGCLAFIFVKFGTFLTLRITHEAVSAFSWGGDKADKLVRMWATPTLENPWPQTGVDAFVPNAEMIGAESFGSVVIAIWVWVILGLMLSFLISFCLCSHTVIYFLLRRAVDATDIEEVYMEDAEEEELPVEQHVAVEGPDEAAPKPSPDQGSGESSGEG